jgi:hypothetical protein
MIGVADKQVIGNTAWVYYLLGQSAAHNGRLRGALETFPSGSMQDEFSAGFLTTKNYKRF